MLPRDAITLGLSMTLRQGDAVLCVVHYPSNTGFAWTYFEGLYAGIADALARDGIRTLVSYPVIEQPPKRLVGTKAEPIVLDASLLSIGSVFATIREARKRNIRTIYFTDRGWWHWAFPLLRLTGIRRIVSHDHTSGARTTPRGLKRFAKWLKARVPGTAADLVIAVSEYVANRQRNVVMIPGDRVVRLWYGIEMPASNSASAPIPEMADGRPIVLCVCRAAQEKGVDHLIRAFDKVVAVWPDTSPRPRLVYVGDGPELANLRALAASLPSRDDVVLTGYRSDVPNFLAHATVSVVPSVWQDACPLGVLEPMAHAKPVIASSVGGVPDEINSPDVGELVPPGDSDALARAL
ncbi:MAG TPA: glycosyltransferase family 4 protein, partial [Gemmatimonadaceae bacterium]|nr:glycosyltransferase family 4 protein [Gemmatimonadaceae bacterium]